MWISNVAIHLFWFSQFMSGLQKQVGEVKKREEAMTIDIVNAIQDILHAKWGKTNEQKIRRCIAEMGAWIIGGFCVGLRGEEMMLIKLSRTAKSLRRHLLDPKLLHFVLIISSRTKGSQLSGSKLDIP
jgi:hypothetical protein